MQPSEFGAIKLSPNAATGASKIQAVKDASPRTECIDCQLSELAHHRNKAKKRKDSGFLFERDKATDEFPLTAENR
jgi:hypothetical protein